jgi:hypothetical protein
MRWISSADSLKTIEPSLLAVLETIVATTLILIVVFISGNAYYITLWSCFGWTMLLRTERSTLRTIKLLIPVRQRVLQEMTSLSFSFPFDQDDTTEKIYFYDEIWTFFLRSIYLLVVFFLLPLIFIFSSVFIKFYTTIESIVFDFWSTIRSIPNNWTRSVLKMYWMLNLKEVQHSLPNLFMG